MKLSKLIIDTANEEMHELVSKKRDEKEMAKKTIEELKREELILAHFETGKNKRDLDETDKKILRSVVECKLNICDEISKMKDMYKIGKTQRLLDDINCLIHIFRKKDGTI